MQTIWGEIGVVQQRGDQVLLVVQVKGGAAIQTRADGPQYLPTDAQVFILLDGPAAHWAAAMERLGRTHVSVFEYGESAYMLHEALRAWSHSQQGSESAPEPLPPDRSSRRQRTQPVSNGDDPPL